MNLLAAGLALQTDTISTDDLESGTLVWWTTGELKNWLNLKFLILTIELRICEKQKLTSGTTRFTAQADEMCKDEMKILNLWEACDWKADKIKITYSNNSTWYIQEVNINFMSNIFNSTSSLNMCVEIFHRILWNENTIMSNKSWFLHKLPPLRS